jgi:chemotaxis protein CheX
MSNVPNITKLLNSIITATGNVIPLSHEIGKPALINDDIVQPEMGVLIGIIGDVRGRLILEAKVKTFQSIGKIMFGMELEDAMLESFAGELGNMIGGNLSTSFSQQEIVIDITPPTVLVGTTKLSGFSKTLVVPIQLQEAGDMNIMLNLEEKTSFTKNAV